MGKQEWDAKRIASVFLPYEGRKFWPATPFQYGGRKILPHNSTLPFLPVDIAASPLIWGQQLQPPWHGEICPNIYAHQEKHLDSPNTFPEVPAYLNMAFAIEELIWRNLRSTLLLAHARSKSWWRIRVGSSPDLDGLTPGELRRKCWDKSHHPTVAVVVVPKW